MASSILQLLSDASDLDICYAVYDRLIECYGDDVDVSSLPQEYRTVFTVLLSRGVIGNGGFNYLFEGEILGDPHFEVTAESFRAIGCREAADAFQRALDLFPKSKPPIDTSQRLAIYRRGDGKIRHEIDNQFWQADDAIVKCLAAFIRAHAKDFISLDAMERTAPKRQDLPQIQNGGPTMDLDILPHWARVAFAARCTRQVLPIFDLAWPDASERRRRSIVDAITLAESSAAKGQPDGGLAKAKLDAVMTAGAALLSLYGIPSSDNETLPTDGNKATIASFVAKAAEKTMEAALASPSESAHFAVEAFSFARSAAGDRRPIIERMWADLDRLTWLSSKQNWSDHSHVPPDIFGADKTA